MSWGRTGVALGALLVACSSRVDVASHGQDVSNDGGGSGGTGAFGAGGSTDVGGTGAAGATDVGGGGTGAAGATDVGGDGTGAAGAAGFGTGAAPGSGGFGAGGSTDPGGFGTGAAGGTGFGGFGTGAAPGAGGSTDIGGATGSIGGATQIALSDGGILTCVAAAPGITSVGANGYRVVVLDVKDQADGGLPGARVGVENWRVALNDERGDPVTNASFSIAQWMPAMGHPGPNDPDVSGGEQGIYDISNLTFNMSGFWTVTLSLTRSGAVVDTVQFAVCVSGGG